MSYKYLDNMPLDKALSLYIDELKKLNVSLTAEKVPVKESLGRITAEAVFAKISSPHFNAAAMDGIAVLAKSTFGATDTTPVILRENIEFERVDTGDPLPESYDCVVMIEDVIDMQDGNIKLISSAVPWQNVRQIGEDICQSEIILTSNSRITPSAIGAMLAGGVLDVTVKQHIVLGIIPTGDEIVKPSENPKKGDIIEFNSAIFSAMVEEWGFVTKIYDIVPDKSEMIKDAVLKASKECSLVILNAGSSAGREDLSANIIGEAGRMLVHGIAIRPGKPTILGIVNNKPVIGVPGYPVSGIIVMEKLVKQVVSLMSGIPPVKVKSVKAVLSRRIVSSLKYREFVRIKLGRINEKLIATPLNRGAGVVTSFMKADGILDIPMDNEGVEAGSIVDVELLRGEEEIENTLVITGSHDPLIDIAADIMRQKFTDGFISSSHVGSMGGLMAVKRSEAHIAGIHLLDEETGDYNKSYIKRYFPEGEAALIKGVKRVQGIITAKGNPKNILSLKDLCKEGISYVNRQKGSGTRILLDFLLKKSDISTDSIYGYEREEFTHMSVAALIASESADAGLGIFSAAKVYDLDFIPICEEHYDFLVQKRFLQTEYVQKFKQILMSEEFTTALESMGGYVFENTGEILTD